jgi:16S rRNA (cytidine1402-2'-O)-methyltransferase
MDDSAPLPPGLYIVATPIGNLGDITVRASDVLARCSGIACEDTRVTGKLLRHLGISKPLWRYDDHASTADRERLLQSMRDRAVALVSDAGMPLVSDPGYRLVRDAKAAGIPVTALPGANAPLTALALSGLPNDRFLFAGFLPSNTLIFFETAPRLTKSLAAIDEVLPGREVAVARELTKIYEECRSGSPAEIAAHYTSYPPKGEIVLLVGPPPEELPNGEAAEAMLRELLATEKASKAVAQVAKATGLDRKELYALAMEIKGE